MRAVCVCMCVCVKNYARKGYCVHSLLLGNNNHNMTNCSAMLSASETWPRGGKINHAGWLLSQGQIKTISQQFESDYKLLKSELPVRDEASPALFFEGGMGAGREIDFELIKPSA